MSVEQSDVVDIVSVDATTGHVVLSISDHLDWSDARAHEIILQRKLNTYLAFVESGEILKSYPNAKDRPVTFNIVFKFRPSPEGQAFLKKVMETIESAGFGFRYELFAESYDN